MTQVELLFILAVSLYVAFAAMDRWTRLRHPRPSHRQRIDPRKTWALEHELDLYAGESPERRVSLFNHGLGCARCAVLAGRREVPLLAGPR